MPQKEPPGTGTWGVSTNVCIECIGQTAKFACSNRTRKVSAWLIQTSQSVRSIYTALFVRDPQAPVPGGSFCGILLGLAGGMEGNFKKN